MTTGTAARAGTPARAAARRRPFSAGPFGSGPVGEPWLAAWPVVGLVAVAGLAVLAAIGIVSRAGAWALPAADELPVDLTVGVGYSLSGGFVLAARAGNRVLGWVLLGVGLAGALTALSTAVALTATGADPALPVLLAVHLQGWLWVPGFLPLVTLVPLLYPSGLLPGLRWRAAAGAGAAGLALVSAGVALYPEPFRGAVAIDKPWTAAGAAQVLTPVGAGLLLVAGVAGLVSLVLRLRRSTGLPRRQIAVLFAAGAVLIADIAAQPLLPRPAAVISQAVAVALVPLAIGLAVTRHRLYDLDLAICRALAGASLAVCLGGLYATLLAVLGAALPGGGPLSGALAAGLTGLVVQPLAARLTRGVDRLYYGDRADPYEITSTLGRQLRDGPDPAEVPRLVCEAVVGSLRLRWAELSVVLDGHDRPLWSVGAAGAPSTQFELRHHGEAVGRLAVLPRAGERVVDPRDAEVLAALADYAAPAVAALRLHQRLQQSREALVAAREEERRRLRRDLHDGLGAVLAGVRLQVESARELVADPVAGPLLDAAAAGVSHAVADIRQLTDDLRPAALDEIGLAAGSTSAPSTGAGRSRSRCWTTAAACPSSRGRAVWGWRRCGSAPRRSAAR